MSAVIRGLNAGRFQRSVSGYLALGLPCFLFGNFPEAIPSSKRLAEAAVFEHPCHGGFPMGAMLSGDSLCAPTHAVCA